MLRHYFDDEQIAALAPRLRPDSPAGLDYYPLLRPGASHGFTSLHTVGSTAILRSPHKERQLTFKLRSLAGPHSDKGRIQFPDFASAPQGTL